MKNMIINSIIIQNKVIPNKVIPNKDINNEACKETESLYLKCMKQNDPSHIKCKNEFEQWYTCFKLFTPFLI